MNRKHYILGTLALLCLLGTGYYAWTLYDAHRKQVAEWNEGAKAAFEEALWMEVDKRAEIPFTHSSNGREGMTTFKEKIPDTVFITSHLGRIGYLIEHSRYENSLIKERKKRANLSTLFNKYPLLIDTLLVHWDSLLSEKQIIVDNYIRYIYTDLELHNDTLYSIGYERFSQLDSLTVKYLGFRCEHEVVAYVSWPYWMSVINKGDWCILLFSWILLILLFVYFSKLESLVERKLTLGKVIEKEIIVRTEVRIVDVQINEADVFKLPDGTLFDSFAKVLSKGEIRHSIQPQSVSLLKLFLSKSDYKVTSTEISLGLWKEEREKEKLYSAIRRLRNDLKTVNSELVIRCTGGEYELESPISSKKSEN